MAQDLLQDDPELAYLHARAAADRAGRVDIAREFAGLTSYFTDRFSEAVRELRTFQRLSGSQHHMALLVDSLRALGQNDEAIDLASSAKRSGMDGDEWFELVIVLAGARADQEQFDAALANLAQLRRSCSDPGQLARIDEAQSRIEALADGRLVDDEVPIVRIPSDHVVDWVELEDEDEPNEDQDHNEGDLTDSGQPDQLEAGSSHDRQEGDLADSSQPDLIEAAGGHDRQEGDLADSSQPDQLEAAGGHDRQTDNSEFDA